MEPQETRATCCPSRENATCRCGGEGGSVNKGEKTSDAFLVSPGPTKWSAPHPPAPTHIHTLQGRSLSSVSPRPSAPALLSPQL